MLITFTTEHGNLIIRAEDLRRLEDEPVRNGAHEVIGVVCRVEWTENGESMHFQYVQGTAAENRERIVQQEAEVIAAYEAAQRRADRQQHMAELQTKARTVANRGAR